MQDGRCASFAIVDHASGEARLDAAPPMDRWAATDLLRSDILEDIPDDSAAALILLEHHWAVPLRDAIAQGQAASASSDGFISPLDLVEIGLRRVRGGGRPRSSTPL